MNAAVMMKEVRRRIREFYENMLQCSFNEEGKFLKNSKALRVLSMVLKIEKFDFLLGIEP
jgi:hypothetical protein